MQDAPVTPHSMPPPPGCVATAPRGAAVTQDPDLLNDQAECWNQVLLVLGDIMRSEGTDAARRGETCTRTKIHGA